MAALNVLAFSGSLRKASFNSMLLRQLQRLAPAHGLAIEIWARLGELPMYDADVHAAGLPPAVVDFRQRLARADGLLIASPEYNHSVAGTTKTLIDWASRPPDQPFAGKPIAVTGATIGALGTALGQYALRLCFVYLDGRIMNQPEVFVGQAQTKFDAAGNLTDAATNDMLGKYLAAFAAWIEKVGVRRG
jgi:chromate reductase, NAD(P)H dehydrogenase (quinone)